MSKVKQLITRYHLSPHPEGGWFKQTYKSEELIPAASLPARFKGSRPFSTAICFLLEEGSFSAFHRIRSDECWHFYSGGPLHIYVISENGELQTITLGNDMEKGQLFQYVVPANCWFASRPVKGAVYSFVGCTVAPGFDFDDFELAGVNELKSAYLQHSDIIGELCRR